MSARGTTLIELMVTVAMLGIGVATLGTAAWHDRREAQDRMLEEKALLVLEAEAEAQLRTGGRGGRDMAEGELPGHFVTRSAAPDGTIHLTVSWKSSRGMRSRALTVFGEKIR